MRGYTTCGVRPSVAVYMQYGVCGVWSAGRAPGYRIQPRKIFLPTPSGMWPADGRGIDRSAAKALFFRASLPVIRPVQALGT